MSDSSDSLSPKLSVQLTLLMPLALIVFVTAATWWTYQLGRIQASESVRSEAIRDLRWTASRFESIFERAYRHGEFEEIQEDVAALATNREFRFVVLTDENYKVLHSMRVADIGKQFDQVLPAAYKNAPLLQLDSLSQIRQRKGGEIEASGDGRTVIAAHPLVLGRRSSELRPNRIGSFILVSDYSAPESAALQLGTREAVGFFTMSSLMAAAFGLFLHFAVARRLRRLARAAEHFGSGDTQVQTGVGGSDEVGSLARSIDKMMVQKTAANKERHESEERLRAILESATDAIITIDVHGIIESANHATEQLFGYTNTELIGKNVKLLMPSPYADEHDDYLANYARTGEAKIIGIGREVVARRKDGTTFPIDLAVSQLTVQDKRLFTGIVRDSSDRHQAEELQTSVGRIVEDSLNEIYIFDADNLRFLQANRGARENIGYSMEELWELTPVDIKPEYTAERFAEIVKPLKNGKQERIVFETVHARKDGSQYDVEVHLQMAQFQGKRCFTATILDITERIEAAQKLAHMNEELEARVQQRTQQLEDAQEQLVRSEKLATLGQLAGGVAHEIRNPMGVIKNAVYFLKQVQSDEDEDIKDALGEISRGLANSERIVSELIDYASGPSTEVSLFPLDEALTAALEMVRMPGSIDLERPRPFDTRIRADRGQIERLLANLIQNAVQAMPSGGALTLHCDAVDGSVVTEVSDTGVGIAANEMEKVFEPLFTTRAKGIGLGLSLCRRYAELNGGSLTVESKLGEGSTFRVSLPLAKNNGA